MTVKEMRQRIEELKSMYRRLAHTQPKDNTWDWWIPAEIDALEQEIHEAIKAKKIDAWQSVLRQKTFGNIIAQGD